MGRPGLLGALAAVALGFVLVSPALAHSGEEGSGISIEPSQVSAGGTIELAGQGLEPNSDRQINLVGPDVIVPFGTVTTDADGMFAMTVTIPGHLPAGTYTFQAIGDETLTVDCQVTAAPGQAPSEPKNEAVAMVTQRQRPPFELGAFALFVLAVVVVGGALVFRAERIGRALALGHGDEAA